MIVDRVISCSNRACKRLILCSPGDADGQCAVCARAAGDAMRQSWLQAMAERDDARAELEALTVERDNLVLELERERSGELDLDAHRHAIAANVERLARVGRVEL